MKNTRLYELGSFPAIRLIRLLSVGFLIVIGLASSYSADPQKKTGASAGTVGNDSPAPSGYLNKAAPPGLRFAAPPKPPVAYLPPLPITYDPQPVFSSEFAPPTVEIAPPKKIVTPQPTNGPTSIRLPDLVSDLGSKRTGNIPAYPVDMGSVSPQMLVRFFHDGRPGGVEMLLTNGISFQVPVREGKPVSSASYEVK